MENEVIKISGINVIIVYDKSGELCENCVFKAEFGCRNDDFDISCGFLHYHYEEIESELMTTIN